MKQERRPLTEGDVRGRLLELAGPMLFAIVSTMLFNLIDTYFVGQLGTRELAAIGFTFPVVQLVASIALGLGVGTTATVANLIGRGERGRVRRVVRDALILALALVGLVATLGLLTIDPVFRALGADAHTLPLIRDYMEVWFLGMVALVVPMVGNSALRGTGEVLLPAKIMIAAALLNAVLDPLLIFGWGPVPGMGMRGAAIASVLARVGALVLSGWVLVARERLVAFERPTWAETRASWCEVLGVGGPAAVSNLLNPVSMAVVTGIVATFGAEAVAAFATGGRIYAFVSMPLMGLGLALTPFAGQNWGAGTPARVLDALAFSRRLSVLWGVACWVGLSLLADPIARVFSDDPQVVQGVTWFVRITLLGVACEGWLFAANATFQATGSARAATVASAFKLLVLLVPLSWIGARLGGLTGVFVAFAAANGVAGSLALPWARRSLSPAEPTPCPA